MFEECTRLFDVYCGLHEPDQSFNTRAGVEFRRRLAQLEYFLSEVQRRDEVSQTAQAEIAERMIEAHEALAARGLAWDDQWPDDITAAMHAPASQPVDMGALSFEMETLTEAFYFFVGRVRELLRKETDGERLFPGLGDLPYRGAVRVRDKLVEHLKPDGNAPRGVGSLFASGGTRGPVLRLEQSAEADSGLYSNAEQLAKYLENKLRSALPRDP